MKRCDLLNAECLDEAHFERETFVDVGMQVAFELAQNADAFGHITRFPFRSEGGGGLLKLWQAEMLRSRLLTCDIAHP